MFNNYVVILASLLLNSFIKFEWYEFMFLLFYCNEYIAWTKFSNDGYKI